MQAPPLAKSFHAFNTTCKNHSPDVTGLIANEILFGGVDKIYFETYNHIKKY